MVTATLTANALTRTSAFHAVIEDATTIENVTNALNGAFADCTNLLSVSSESVTNIGGFAFYYCVTLEGFDFPLVTNIGNSAFYACSLLTAVEFPPTLLEIGGQAFGNCIALTEITFNTQIPPGISINSFISVPNVATRTLYVPCPDFYTSRT